MSGFHIRPAVVSEQKTLEALQWRASLINPGYREALLANPDAIELPAEQIEAGGVFVLEQNGAIIAFSAVLPRDDGRTELDGLFVDPDFWRHGFGRLLVNHCAEDSRVQGSSALHVIASPDAERFYLACGFKSIGVAKTRSAVPISGADDFPGAWEPSRPRADYDVAVDPLSFPNIRNRMGFVEIFSLLSQVALFK